MRLNIPPVTRVLLILTGAVSPLYAAARWGPVINGSVTSSGDTPLVPYLALVPAYVWTNPWTLITSTFVEQNIFTFLINCSAVFFAGRYLERAWGSRNFALVTAIAMVVPNIVIVPTYMLWGTATLDETRKDTPITGAITLQALFLVAFKQLVPEHTVSVYKGLVKMRVKHFPAVFLLLNTMSGLVFGTDTAMFLSWYGLFTTWVYLRFFQTQPDVSGSMTGTPRLRGDASETFAFATFFPDVMQPPIAAACNQIYILACNVKLLQPFTDEAIASGNEQAAARGETGLPSLMSSSKGPRGTGKREEAERRRALALAALDQRLTASESRSNTAHETIQAPDEAASADQEQPSPTVAS